MDLHDAISRLKTIIESHGDIAEKITSIIFNSEMRIFLEVLENTELCTRAQDFLNEVAQSSELFSALHTHAQLASEHSEKIWMLWLLFGALNTKIPEGLPSKHPIYLLLCSATLSDEQADLFYRFSKSVFGQWAAQYRADFSKTDPVNWPMHAIEHGDDYALKGMLHDLMTYDEFNRRYGFQKKWEITPDKEWKLNAMIALSRYSMFMKLASEYTFFTEFNDDQIGRFIEATSRNNQCFFLTDEFIPKVIEQGKAALLSSMTFKVNNIAEGQEETKSDEAELELNLAEFMFYQTYLQDQASIEAYGKVNHFTIPNLTPLFEIGLTVSLSKMKLACTTADCMTVSTDVLLRPNNPDIEEAVNLICDDDSIERMSDADDPIGRILLEVLKNKIRAIPQIKHACLAYLSKQPDHPALVKLLTKQTRVLLSNHMHLKRTGQDTTESESEIASMTSIATIANDTLEFILTKRQNTLLAPLVEILIKNRNEGRYEGEEALLARIKRLEKFYNPDVNAFLTTEEKSEETDGPGVDTRFLNSSLLEDGSTPLAEQLVIFQPPQWIQKLSAILIDFSDDDDTLTTSFFKNNEFAQKLVKSIAYSDNGTDIYSDAFQLVKKLIINNVDFGLNNLQLDTVENPEALRILLFILKNSPEQREAFLSRGDLRKLDETLQIQLMNGLFKMGETQAIVNLMNKELGIDRELYLKLARAGCLEDEAFQSGIYAEHWAAYQAEQAAASAPTNMFAPRTSHIDLKLTNVPTTRNKEAIDLTLSDIIILTDGQAQILIDSVLVNPHITSTEKRALLQSFIETGKISEDGNPEPHARIQECVNVYGVTEEPRMTMGAGAEAGAGRISP